MFSDLLHLIQTKCLVFGVRGGPCLGGCSDLLYLRGSSCAVLVLEVLMADCVGLERAHIPCLM